MIILFLLTKIVDNRTCLENDVEIPLIKTLYLYICIAKILCLKAIASYVYVFHGLLV